ncbi:hypothetical protein B0H14DRAFT_2690329 [Mycena olivaceomarginata]|nr:hypothetical protein B0H14DRAFT_2690329 [Mycena olivaceomarginata]
MMYVSLVNRIEQNQSEHLQMVSSRPRAQNTKRPRSKSDAFKVPKYKTVQNVVDDESEDQEEIDFTGVGPFYMGKFSVNGKGKEKKAIAAPQARSPKRRKVAHDFGFLETSLPHATTPASASDSAFAVPSSDLLKYIHHFACNYYSDRAQLFHESRTWRKERKERRAREAAEAKLMSPSETVTPQRRDMYKTMDGSALLTIGMLLQEHIGRILAPRIPDGWEQGNLNESEEEEESPHTEVQDTEDQDAEPEDERDQEGVGDGDEISGNEGDSDGEDEQDTDWMATEST